MQSIWKSKGEKLHTRIIEVTTYNYDEQRIIVEGFLKDDRFQNSYLVSGEKLPAGTIHHMAIRLLVNCSNLLIEDIDIDLIAVPRKVCHETIKCLAPIKGMTIARGFTAKVKKIAGGKNGCTHLVELMLAMAPAAFQGYAAFQSQKQKDFDPDRAKMVLQYLRNTCHAWRDDGPLAQEYKTMLNME
jgi:hypothetical protein